MGRIVWTPQALGDLDDIGDYIGRFAPDQAVAVLRAIHSAMMPVRQFSRTGRVVPELEHEDVREIIVGRFRIIYELDGDDARVVHVVHAQRDVRAYLLDLGYDVP